MKVVTLFCHLPQSLSENIDEYERERERERESERA